jgi:hypothetical protein
MLFNGSTSPREPAAPSGAHRIFREDFGQSFSEFLIECRNVTGGSHVSNAFFQHPERKLYRPAISLKLPDSETM